MELLLSGQHTCLIDDQDHSLIRQFHWYCQSNRSYQRVKRYAFTRIGKSCLSMHRFIMAPPEGTEIDHINGNGLDNRRKNLRLCEPYQNRQNHPGWLNRVSNTMEGHPIYKGVYRPRRVNGKNGGRIWEAKLCFESRQRYIGSFDLPELAALAYDDWARCFHGRFARLNFPQAGEIGVHDRV